MTDKATEDATSVLPAVLKPGTHQTAFGTEEVSTADFAQKILALLPEQAGLFRMADVPGTLDGDPGAKTFTPLTLDRTRLLVDRHVRVVSSHMDEDTSTIKESYQPSTKDLAGLVMAQAQSDPCVRPLRLVVRHPVYLAGFDLASPGWNAKGGVYYDEPPHLAGIVPSTTPNLGDLGDLLIDFKMKDQASRENVYALMFTRILRPAIDGPTPFFFVMSSIERIGKGKILDTCSLAVCGERMPVMQVGGDEDEREKRITSLILRGASSIHFDNVPQGEDFDSAAIASLATAYPNWGGRILGQSSTPSIPNNVVVAFSGNNPKATGELVKRSVPIAFDPTDDHPELRTAYVHEDCYAWGLDCRRKILETILGAVEAWKAAGRPPPAQRMGGFERWCFAVLGPLGHVGATAALANYRDWCAVANDSDLETRCLIDAWARVHQTTDITASQVLELVEQNDIFHAVLAKQSKAAQRSALAKIVLARIVDRPVGNWIVRRTSSGTNRLYHLQATFTSC